MRADYGIYVILLPVRHIYGYVAISGNLSLSLSPALRLLCDPLSLDTPHNPEISSVWLHRLRTCTDIGTALQPQKNYSTVNFLLVPPLAVPEILIFIREHKQPQRTSSIPSQKHKRWKKKQTQRKGLNDSLVQFMSLGCKHWLFRVQWARWTCFTWAFWLYTHPGQIPWQTLLYENLKDLPNTAFQGSVTALPILSVETLAVQLECEKQRTMQFLFPLVSHFEINQLSLSNKISFFLNKKIIQSHH